MTTQSSESNSKLTSIWEALKFLDDRLDRLEEHDEESVQDFREKIQGIQTRLERLENMGADRELPKDSEKDLTIKAWAQRCAMLESKLRLLSEWAEESTLVRDGYDLAQTQVRKILGDENQATECHRKAVEQLLAEVDVLAIDPLIDDGPFRYPKVKPREGVEFVLWWKGGHRWSDCSVDGLEDGDIWRYPPPAP